MMTAKEFRKKKGCLGGAHTNSEINDDMEAYAAYAVAESTKRLVDAMSELLSVVDGNAETMTDSDSPAIRKAYAALAAAKAGK